LGITDAVLGWLVEEENPSVRYRTLSELLDRSPGDAEVRGSKSRIPDSPAVAALFAPTAPDGSWQYPYRDQRNRYFKFMTASLSHAAELGLERGDERVCRAVEHLFSFQKKDGDFHRHYSCYNGLILRALNRLGFGRDKRTVRLRQLLCNSIRHDGGFHCDLRVRRRAGATGPHKSCIKGSLKALLAFAEDDELCHTRECDRLAAYFLKRHVLFRTSALRTPVVRGLTQLAFPITYHPSLIEAVYAMARLGYGRHPEMGDAWSLLAERQCEDGRFPLQKACRWPHLRTVPRGRPSKWLTLYVRLAWKHQEKATAVGSPAGDAPRR
jgi:hypothetical protein